MRHRIPTAGFRRFDRSGAAKSYLESCTQWPQVIKADGLAAGKGVFVMRRAAGRLRRGRRLDGGAAPGRGRGAARDRGVPGRRGGLGAGDHRRRGLDGARAGDGPQAGRRGRQRAQHGRHGGLFARAGHDAALDAPGRAARAAADALRARARRHRLPRRAVRGPDDDRRRAARARVQLPLRRPRDAGVPQAHAERPRAVPVGRGARRARLARGRPGLGRARLRRRRGGQRGLSRELPQGRRHRRPGGGRGAARGGRVPRRHARGERRARGHRRRARPVRHGPRRRPLRGARAGLRGLRRDPLGRQVLPARHRLAARHGLARAHAP